MTINTKDLPSKAILGEKLLEIPTVTMGVLSRFSSLPSSTEAERMYKDLVTYIEAIDNWQELCAYDYTALIYLIKSSTLLKNGNSIFTVTCPSCQKENVLTADLSKTLEFDDISDELVATKELTIHGITVQKIIPTMQELKTSLSILIKANDKLSREEIMMRVFFNFAEHPNTISSALFNSTKEDYALIKYYMDLCGGLAKYTVPVYCSKCKEVIRIAKSDFFASDPFRNIILNFPLRKE